VDGSTYRPNAMSIDDAGRSAPGSGRTEVDPELIAARERVDALARLMDDAFRLPGTNRRFGLDSVAGLIPGVGDLATGAAGAYILLEAWKVGAPKPLLAKMLGNLAADAAIGAVPVVGDVCDFFFKASRRNRDLLVRHLDERCAATARPVGGGRAGTDERQA
jgi:hypothetical protein